MKEREKYVRKERLFERKKNYLMRDRRKERRM